MDFTSEFLKSIEMNYHLAEIKYKKLMQTAEEYEKKGKLDDFVINQTIIPAAHLITHVHSFTEEIKRKQPQLYEFIYNESQDTGSLHYKICALIIKAMGWARNVHEFNLKSIKGIADELD